MKFIYSLLFTLCFVTAGIAQDGLYVKYELGIDATGENAAMMETIFQGSYMAVASDANRTYIDMRMGTMMSITMDVDIKSKEMTALMNLMGTQKAYKGIEDKDGDEQDDNDADIKLVDETKDILGITCKKAVMKSPDGEDINFWYTEDYKRPEGMKQLPSKIPGLCLEFESITNGMKMSFTATEFSDNAKIDAYKLTIPEGVEVEPIENMGKMGQN